jgi:hypothetical protein
MRALDRVLAALEARECRPRGNEQRGFVALCPAHDDHRPSLSVAFKNDKVLLKCFAGCDTEAVLNALALDWPDLFEEEPCRT